VHRILLFSGKGGVGKTTIAAATALAAAQAGHRTLLLSFDIAHSLSDAFALDRSLFDHAGGRATPVAPGLDIQEIDVQAEVEASWREAGNAFSLLLAASGVDNVAAADLALMPGMEDLITLLHLNRHARDASYDALVIDCPPTGDSLRFVSLPRTIDWYLRKRFALGDVAEDSIRDRAGRAPETLLDLRRGLAGVEALLQDATRTSVRLVTLPERMVVRESQRAFMYFSLFGLVVDRVVVNRVFPATGGAAAWRRTQEPALQQLRALFAPITIAEVPFYPDEVTGPERLRQLAAGIYGGADPLAPGPVAPVFRLEPHERGSRLVVAMPFVASTELDLHREDDCLIVRVGSFKRHLPLPRALQRVAIRDARIHDGQLVVEFADDTRQPAETGS
jgi:arsenite-transporting ATPase